MVAAGPSESATALRRETRKKTSDRSFAVHDTAARDTADARLAPVAGLLGVDLGVVVLADEAAADDREPITGHQANAADGAREAVDVVGVLARSHHQLRGRDRLTTRRAAARRAEHPASKRRDHF